MTICKWLIPGQIPGQIRGIHEHGAGTGADPLQRADLDHPRQSAGPEEGHHRPGGHVVRAGGRLRQHDGRQGQVTLLTI